MKIAMTDVETTGLDADVHEIIEIGLVVFDDASFEILDRMDVKVIPLRPDIHGAKTYEINGYTKEHWINAMSLKKAISMYAEKAKDTMFAGYNVTLDFIMITKALKQCEIENQFFYTNYHKIDIFTLAWTKIPHDKIEKWSLKSICQYLGIPPEPEPHRAINGAMVEFEVYKKLMTK